MEYLKELIDKLDNANSRFMDSTDDEDYDKLFSEAYEMHEVIEEVSKYLKEKNDGKRYMPWC